MMVNLGWMRGFASQLDRGTYRSGGASTICWVLRMVSSSGLRTKHLQTAKLSCTFGKTEAHTVVRQA